MKMTAILLALVCAGAIAKDKPDVVYAGGGRYTCSGSSYQCAQVDAGNRALEERQRAKDDARLEREREQRQRDLDRYKTPRRDIAQDR